jgi:hypothetical protein
MDGELKAVKRAIAALDGRGRTERIPDAVRRRVAVYVRSARARGVAWRELARRTTLSVGTLKRFATADGATVPSGRPVLVPVELRREPACDARARELVLVTPEGWRLEGLSVPSAAELLRRLAS